MSKYKININTQNKVKIGIKLYKCHWEMNIDQKEKEKVRFTDRHSGRQAPYLDVQSFTPTPVLLVTSCWTENINSLNVKLNPICRLLALLGAHHIFHVSRIRVK